MILGGISRRFWLGTALALAPALYTFQALAQQPGTPSVITANARLVILDTSVTDAAGHVVEGLTINDFQVYEDGKLQRIRSVEPPSAHALPADSGGLTTVYDPAQPASFGQSPVNVLVLDQTNTHFFDSAYGVREMKKYLSGQPALLREPTALLTVYDDHFKQLESFTRDRDALLRVLAAAPTHYAWALEVNGNTDVGPLIRLDATLRALEQIAQAYARIPGRKNLVWVGAGYPNVDPVALEADSLHEIQDTIHHVTNVLLNDRVTVYTVDPTSTAPGMTEVTDATQMAFFLAAGDASAGGIDPFGTTEDFDRLGPLTGGRTIRGLNNVAEQIGRAIDSGTNFYTIAYTPDSDSKAKGAFRHIKVVCLRQGVTVESRNGYYAESTSAKQVHLDAAFDLTTAAESTVPLNALRVTVAAGALPQSYTVRVSTPNLTWRPREDGGAVASVYVMAVSLDAKGKMLGHTLHGMTASARAGVSLTDPERTADFDFPVMPAAKAVTLRFVVRDSATGKLGSYDLPLSR